MLVKIAAYLCIIAGVLSGSHSQEDACGIQKVDNDLSVGKNASLREFPWVALLRYEQNNSDDAGVRCVGSLISPRHVLTAAHCVLKKDMKLKSVRLGEHDLTTDPDCVKQDDCADAPQDIEVEKVTAHENYDITTGNNSIALIKLMGDAVFTDSVRPICLASPKYNADPGDKVILSGWGYSIREPWPTKKKVISSIINNGDCQKDYDNVKKNILDSQVCAKAFEDNIAFACGGDSGGPVMLLKDDRWYQEAIVSFGIGCGSKIANVNIRVESYLDWINEKVKTM